MGSPDAFTPMQLFSFPLFACVVGEHEEHRAGLVQHILEQQQRSPGAKRSNRGGWHSDEDFMTIENPHVGWVLKTVTTFARRALAPYYGGWASNDLKLGHYWANVLGKGGWNSPHHHIPTHWSGSFYVSVGGVGTVPGNLGGIIEFLNPTPLHSLVGLGGNFAYTPKDGLILLFPASLLHLVHPHSGDEPRISIAYNFNVVPKAQPAR